METMRLYGLGKHKLHGRMAYAVTIGMALAVVGNFALMVALLIDRFGSS